jgi:hypothetical protein
MDGLFFAHLTDKNLSDTLGGGDFDFPDLIQGDTLHAALRFVKTIDGEDVEVPVDVKSLRASLGPIGDPPTSGAFGLRLVGSEQDVTLDAATDTVSPDSGSNPFQDGDRIRFKTTGTLDSGLQVDRDFYVVSAQSLTFQVATSSGGTAVSLSGNGSGQLQVIQTTSDVGFDTADTSAAATALQSAINGLVSVGNSVPATVEGDTFPEAIVEVRDGSFFVRFPGHVGAVPLEAGSNSLLPISFVRVRNYELSGETVHEIRLVQAPLAFTDLSSRVVPSAPSISSVQDGGEIDETTWNEIQKLYLPPDFRGTYQIRRASNYARSAILSRLDGAEQIQQAIAVLADEGGEFSVTNPEPNVALIEFQGTMGATDQDLLEIVIVDAPDGDVTFDLDLSRAEIGNFLRGRKQVEDVPLEIEIVFRDENDSTIERVWTYRTDVTLLRELIWDGLADEKEIDWLQPPLPRDYVPFDPSQVITGSQHHTSTIGDGSSTAISITHGLSTEDLHVSVRENTSGGTLLVSGDDYTVTLDNDDQVTINVLGSAPALAAWAVTITTAGPVSAFVDDLQIEIAQVNNLQTILDAFGSDISTLLAALPTGLLAVKEKDSGLSTSWTLPSVYEIFPSRREFKAGTPLIDLANIKEKDLPRAGGLLPALPLADASYVGRVFENTGTTDVTISGGLGRRSSTLKPGEFVACDGRVWYRVEQFGDQVASPETSFYPADFTQELFRIYVNDKQLRLKTTLESLVGLELSVLKTNVNATYSLVFEFGTATQDTAPATPGFNLQDIVWNPVPVLEQPLVLMPVPCVHTLGVRVKRFLDGGVDTLAADQLIYGEAISGTPPAYNSFALRARLIRFDTENSVSDPKGFVALRGLDAKIESKDGSDLQVSTSDPQPGTVTISG